MTRRARSGVGAGERDHRRPPSTVGGRTALPADLRPGDAADARRPATIRLDAIGRFADADALALGLLRAGSIADLVAAAPQRFPVLQPYPAERAAWQRAAVAHEHGTPIGEAADAVIAEGLLRPLDGPAVRLRVAFVSCGEQGYVVLCYPIQRRSSDATPELYRIHDVLAAWRGAERRLDADSLTREERLDLACEIELLRALYLLLFDRSANTQQRSPTVSSPG